MDIYILKCLKKLKKDAPRRIKDFRISCDQLIGTINKYTIIVYFI